MTMMIIIKILLVITIMIIIMIMIRCFLKYLIFLRNNHLSALAIELRLYQPIDSVQ